VVNCRFRLGIRPGNNPSRASHVGALPVEAAEHKDEFDYLCHLQLVVDCSFCGVEFVVVWFLPIGWR
jgi:hypothetical protein